MKIKNFC